MISQNYCASIMEISKLLDIENEFSFQESKQKYDELDIFLK